MWTDEVLDKELEGKEELVLPNKWLGVGWLLLGVWLLWEGWNAYFLLHQYDQGNFGLLRLFQPYNYYIETYKLMVQGVFATLLALFYIRGLPRVQHYVLGYVFAGLAFHLVNLLAAYKYPVVFVEEWASVLLVVVSLWPIIKEQGRPSIFTVFLLVLAIGCCLYPELIVGQFDLVLPKLLGLGFFSIFLLRMIRVYFPAFWEPKRWYNYLYPFVGLVPYFIDSISYSI